MVYAHSDGARAKTMLGARLIWDAVDLDVAPAGKMTNARRRNFELGPEFVRSHRSLRAVALACCDSWPAEMGTALSMDLHTRVLDAIDSGVSCRHTTLAVIRLAPFGSANQKVPKEGESLQTVIWNRQCNQRGI